MPRNHNDSIEALPTARRPKVNARAEDLCREVEGLRALRLLAERTQEQIAEGLGIQPPSVHKIDRQSDLYLSSLRRFIEAAGGTMELIITLPGTGAMRLTRIGEITDGELP